MMKIAQKIKYFVLSSCPSVLIIVVTDSFTVNQLIVSALKYIIIIIIIIMDFSPSATSYPDILYILLSVVSMVILNMM